MRPCLTTPLLVRDVAFGAPKPLFCIPLVAADTPDLLAQAEIALKLSPDLIEWRSDAFVDYSVPCMLSAAKALRSLVAGLPVIYTLRSVNEGGANQTITQAQRRLCVEAVVKARLVDVIDIELANESEFLDVVVQTAQENGVRVILSFHDFQATPPNEVLHAAVDAMVLARADIAKLACMPKTPEDALRLLQVTSALRQRLPTLPLCITSMGKLGAISRVAGFLYGSDMGFAVGQQSSAPGQIPIAEARTLAECLLRVSDGTTAR